MTQLPTPPSDPSDPDLGGFKTPMQSQTIVSLLVSMVTLVLTSFCKIIITDQQTKDITMLVGAVVMLGGMASAWYGRVKATKKIG